MEEKARQPTGFEPTTSQLVDHSTVYRLACSAPVQHSLESSKRCASLRELIDLKVVEVEKEKACQPAGFELTTS